MLREQLNEMNCSVADAKSPASLLNNKTDAQLHWEQVERQVVTCILPFLSVMGVTGNALVLYVYLRKKDNLVSSLCIIVLASVDFVTCLVIIPYTIYMENIEYTMRVDFFCKLYHFFITSNIPFSALIMVAIAIDRYCCICHPFWKGLTIRRARLLIAAMGLSASAMEICVALMYGTEHRVFKDWVIPFEVDLSNNSDSGDPGSEETEVINSDIARMANISGTRICSMEIENREKCQENELLISKTFTWYFQKLYTTVFLVCVIVVVILYVLIYRSVLVRRSRREKQKSVSLRLVKSQISQKEKGNVVDSPDVIGEPTCTSEVLKTENILPCNGSLKKKNCNYATRTKRKSLTRDNPNRMANLKTAAMLFVVTTVFVVTFLPAFLMALHLIPGNLIVFYMYFVYNVSNPVIYSFMNKNFLDELKRIFSRK